MSLTQFLYAYHEQVRRLSGIVVAIAEIKLLSSRCSRNLFQKNPVRASLPNAEVSDPRTYALCTVPKLQGAMAATLYFRVWRLAKALPYPSFRLTYVLIYCKSPDRGLQRSEGLLLLHSFLSLDILVAFSILWLL